MNLTATATATGQTVTCTITDEDGTTVDTFSVKDGNGVIRRIDKALADLMWDRSAFHAPGMTATLTRPVLYTMLTKINAR